MKEICLLGATGSIGTQVLNVIRNQKEYRLRSIAFGSNIKRGREIIREFQPDFVSVNSEKTMLSLNKEFPDIAFAFGETGLIEAATYSTAGGYLVNAVVGVVGLRPTVAAIKKGLNILLANKEILVAAGKIINRLLEEYKVQMIPIDSEHSALHQCLKSGPKEDVNRLIITASGGSFRDRSRLELTDVSVEEALKHPNWNMGAKITIDSATMVNKGLEVIEAHHLFGIDYDRIDTVIHPESIIHGIVEYNDRSMIAQMSLPDMHLPIQYALTYPNKIQNLGFQPLKLWEIGSLTFRKMDFDRFPALELAYQAGKSGGLMPAIYNSSNEAAVSLFLKGKIKFLDIENIIRDSISNFRNIQNPSLDEIIAVDHKVKNSILEKYEVK